MTMTMTKTTFYMNTYTCKKKKKINTQKGYTREKASNLFIYNGNLALLFALLAVND